VINYSDKEQQHKLDISDGWKLSPINKSDESIHKCDAEFYYLNRT
jgi:hypothetical protein